MPASNSEEVSRSAEIKSPLKPSDVKLVSPTNDDTWNAREASSALTILLGEGCIEWDEPISERRMMTCGDTLPAVKVVSWERRFFQ